MLSLRSNRGPKELMKISIVIYLAGIFIGGTVHPVEAQAFTPVSSCSSGFSSFAGIVCSGSYIDGEVIHCIFNQDFQLGLVCVEWLQTPAGRCSQYLEEYKAIGSFPCTGGELCPESFFPSHEVHKYPACLNKSLYITEPTTTQADTTEKSSTCKDGADRGNTGQSVSCAVPVTIAVIIVLVTLVIFSCLLMVWEYHRGKFLLGIIYVRPRNGSCRYSAADSPQGSQGGAAVQEGKAQGSPRDVRAIVMCFEVCLAYVIICPAAAQGFAHIQSCTSDLSSFVGIICSGDAVTGKVIHCVFNEHFQAVLVCSEWHLINSGRCPRYIKQYNGIDDFACIGNELCPRGTYKSYEVYKYPACLNSSLYITEPTTTPKDTTEQPSTCRDCGDGGNTGSTTGTETTTKSTLPTDSKCDVVSESSKQSVSCAVPVTIAVIVVLVIFSCLLVWEYHRGKFLLGMIYEPLRNRCHDRVAKKDVPESHEGADVPMMVPAVEVADMGVHPRNGSCHYSAADSSQRSQGGAAVQEGKAQGSPRLVENIIEEI